MSISQHELDSFHQFASEALSNGRRDLDLEVLLQQWRERQAEIETLASIRRGIADAEHGRLKPLAEVDASIRREVGLSARVR